MDEEGPRRSMSSFLDLDRFSTFVLALEVGLYCLGRNLFLPLGEALFSLSFGPGEEPPLGEAF